MTVSRHIRIKKLLITVSHGCNDRLKRHSNVIVAGAIEKQIKGQFEQDEDFRSATNYKMFDVQVVCVPKQFAIISIVFVVSFGNNRSYR
jgi:hypothetical protein